MIRPGGKEVRATRRECGVLALAFLALTISWVLLLAGLFLGASPIRDSKLLAYSILAVGITTALCWAVILGVVLSSGHRNGHGIGRNGNSRGHAQA